MYATFYALYAFLFKACKTAFIIPSSYWTLAYYKWRRISIVSQSLQCDRLLYFFSCLNDFFFMQSRIKEFHTYF